MLSYSGQFNCIFVLKFPPDNLLQLNAEWHSTVRGIEEICVENDETTMKWWDFTRLKKKVIRWIDKKEEDADDSDHQNTFDSITRNVDKFKVY